MLVDNLMVDDGAVIYYDPAFRIALEDHMTYLRTHPATKTIAIEAMAAFRYEYDLFSLLLSLGIKSQLHWLIMRMNMMTGPTDATRDLAILLLPDPTVVDHIRQSHMSSRRIK